MFCFLCVCSTLGGFPALFFVAVALPAAHLPLLGSGWGAVCVCAGLPGSQHWASCVRGSARAPRHVISPRKMLQIHLTQQKLGSTKFGHVFLFIPCLAALTMASYQAVPAVLSGCLSQLRLCVFIHCTHSSNTFWTWEQVFPSEVVEWLGSYR